MDLLGNVYECVSRFEVDKHKTIQVVAFLEIKQYMPQTSKKRRSKK